MAASKIISQAGVLNGYINIAPVKNSQPKTLSLAIVLRMRKRWHTLTVLLMC
ncbi:hypothetical protein HMPREF0454_00658 [Hafnia alvei ATCC 51873]|uniref:Uncharacterized protein n=1 Tax=Hafnia alvei ATCC 51873 TaxID=1002364 RepID=G9Y246_HAFAL|nr:hypothetical protein HMPREF0454_00658 [Hafnia alvei ATCC 51873]